MSNKELLPLGGLSSAEAPGIQGFYVVDADGNSRFISYANLKAAINTDPTVVPASEPFRGALVFRSSNLSVADNSFTTVTWNASQYDTDSIWSVGAPTRLTVPVGVTKVRLGSCVLFEVASYTAESLGISKNGANALLAYPGQAAVRKSYASGAPNFGNSLSLLGPVIEVDAGDYFEIRVIQTSGANRNIEVNSWFSMEIIEATV